MKRRKTSCILYRETTAWLALCFRVSIVFAVTASAAFVGSVTKPQQLRCFQQRQQNTERSLPFFLRLFDFCNYHDDIAVRPTRQSRRLFLARGSSSSSGGGASTSFTPNLDSNDPFQVLGIAPTADLKEIKRAYRRLALQYHPDVSQDSDKKRASDQFAKINWAYQVLTGKQEQSASAASASSSSSSSASSSASSSWTPPHRRSGAYASSSSSSSSSSSGTPRSTDWRDYMPKYEEEEDYDTNGDSLGSIFRDFVTGAAAAAATGTRSGSGIFRDLVEFLEQNLDGYSSSSGGGGDAELRILLQTGTLADIADEMDTTELVVQQLSEKQRNLEKELVMVSAEAKAAVKYMEKLELDEKVAEIEARKRVVEGYIQKARKRLLALQTRYKQMIVQGENDPVAGGRDPSYTGSWSNPTSSSSYSSSTYDSSSNRRPRHEKAEDAWKDDTFGSFGRGRGSSRRRSSQQQATDQRGERVSTPPPSSSYTSGTSSTSSRTPTSRTTTTTTASTSTTASYNLPPHRRPSSSQQQQDDKRRLRDLKVDEAFDNLKKELGL